MHILFLCVANSARSQMAEGLARALFASKHKISSAGSVPKFVHPLAIQAMAEIDIDIRQHRSQSIAEVLTDDVDLVVTLCADEVCPVLPGKQEKLHWPFPDPAGAGDSEQSELENFRRVRNAIRERLQQFGEERDLL